MAEADLRSAAFPKLDEAQMAALGRCPVTSLKRYRDGEKLFEAGQSDPNFYVVKTGQVAVVDESDEPPKTITVHGPGEFTGEVAQVTGGPAVASAVSRGGCEAYEVSPAGLRQILNLHPDLGDVILQAFIARRQLLRESGKFTGLRVIGSRYSQDTFRVRDFLAKNHVPFTWLDLESDPQVKKLLDQFGVSEADTPVVAWGHTLLLRNPSNRQLAEARRPPPAAGEGGVRPGRGRGRAGGAGGGGLRRLRGAPHRRAGAHGARGPGRPQHAHRELPRLPHRHHRRRPGGTRRRAGQQVRGATPRRRPGHRPDVREPVQGAAPRRRRSGDGQVPADRHRGRLPQAQRRRVRAVRGPRRLLRRDPHRGAAVPGVGRGGRRRGQLRRPGVPSSSPRRFARRTW